MNATEIPSGPGPAQRETELRKLFDLPLGSRFRYPGKPTVYVFLYRADCGLVGDEPDESKHRVWQGLYSAAESRHEFENLMVELVRVKHVTGDPA